MFLKNKIIVNAEFRNNLKYLGLMEEAAYKPQIITDTTGGIFLKRKINIDNISVTCTSKVPLIGGKKSLSLVNEQVLKVKDSGSHSWLKNQANDIVASIIKARDNDELYMGILNHQNLKNLNLKPTSYDASWLWQNPKNVPHFTFLEKAAQLKNGVDGGGDCLLVTGVCSSKEHSNGSIHVSTTSVNGGSLFTRNHIYTGAHKHRWVKFSSLFYETKNDWLKIFELLAPLHLQQLSAGLNPENPFDGGGQIGGALFALLQKPNIGIIKEDLKFTDFYSERIAFQKAKMGFCKEHDLESWALDDLLYLSILNALEQAALADLEAIVVRGNLNIKIQTEVGSLEITPVTY